MYHFSFFVFVSYYYHILLFLSTFTAFLTAILKGLEGDVWIGLSTIGQTGNPRDFMWDDGTALNYTNWTPGQPDGDLVSNITLNRNCVAT